MEQYVRNRDIVIVGQQPWDTEIGSNCKNIAQEFARHNRVLYVNSPLDRNTLLKQRDDSRIQQRLRVIRGAEEPIQSVAENLWVLTPNRIIESINWLPDSPVYTLFNKLNNKRFARAIKGGMARLGFQDVLLFNDNDIFRSFYLKELLRPAASIYYSRDFMLATDYWRKHGLALEPALIAKSDVCVANSSYLATYCRQHNPRAYDVGQGCDVAELLAATQAPRPADLPSPGRPVIGYVGALVSLRLDEALLLHVAEQRPEWQLVLIGPEDDAFRRSRLHQLPNVHFPGAKAPEQLAAYIQHFDVCLNPQLVNQMTIGNYPRKIDEYLALGRPVVATRTEAMELFAPYTYLAATKDDYPRLIAQALAEDTPARQAQRRAFAATHTWENSVNQIYKAIIDAGVLARPAPAAAAVPQ